MDPDRFLLMRIASQRAETEVETQVEEEATTRDSDSSSSMTETEKSTNGGGAIGEEDVKKASSRRQRASAWRKSSLPQMLLHPKRFVERDSNVTEEKDDQALQEGGIARQHSFVKIGKALSTLFQKREEGATNMQYAQTTSFTCTDNPMFHGAPGVMTEEEYASNDEEEKTDSDWIINSEDR